MSRQEEEEKLKAALDGTSFVYTDAQWSAISACVPSLTDPVDFRTTLEELANFYLVGTGLGPKSDHTQSIKARASRIAKTARKFLEALDNGWLEPYAYRLGTKNDLVSHQRSYDSMLAAVRGVAEGQEAVAKKWGVEIGGAGRKPIRRSYLERLIICWHAFTGRRMPGRRISDDDPSGMLDFLEAASRPVLIGGDVFGSVNNPRRDTQIKAVADIRETFFYHWDFALNERFNLSSGDEWIAELVRIPSKQ